MVIAWQSLSNLILHALAYDRGEPVHDPRLSAARLMAAAWGFGGPEGLVNVAALALSMRDRLVLHRVSPGAARLVHETDLHSLPGEPPRLLRGPWLIEARNPEEPLFGRTSSLGGYILDGMIFLVGLEYPDGAFVARWTPRWEARDLAAGLPAEDDSPLISDVDRHSEWAREAARFAIVFGLLLESQGTPIEVHSERASRKQARGRAGVRRDWAVRRVILGRLVRRVMETPRAEAGDGQVSALAGRRAEVVPVRGHLRRQAYGPGMSQRRWIYVEGYEARRWVAPRVVVEVRADEKGGTSNG